jgi:hypothetical protein
LIGKYIDDLAGCKPLYKKRIAMRFFIVSCVGEIESGIVNTVIATVAQTSVIATDQAINGFAARYGPQPRTTGITHEYSVKELQEIILKMQGEDCENS